MMIVLAVLSRATAMGQGMQPGGPVIRKRPAAYVRPVTTAIRLAATAMDIWKEKTREGAADTGSDSSVRGSTGIAAVERREAGEMGV